MTSNTNRSDDPLELERAIHAIEMEYVAKFREQMVDHLSPILRPNPLDMDGAQGISDRLDTVAGRVANLATVMAGKMGELYVKSARSRWKGKKG
jgi:hypothetical protein